MAPAALSLITVTFTEPRERARAFGVYGAIAGGGAAIGLILGGVLTEFASWRWTLLINVPIAVVAAVAAFRFVSESRASANHGYDLPGAATVTGGLLALVYGFTKAGTDGWTSSTTLTLFGVAAVLLVAFVVIEQRVAHPLLPLRIVLDRNRGGSFLASLLVGTAILGTFLSLTYYFQGVLHFSALKSGFAFVPFSLGIITGATAASRLLPRIGPRAQLTGGLLMAVAGLVLFSTLDVHSSYVSVVLPAEVIVSVGMGLSFVALSSTALIGVSPEDAGVASALVNATQQTGGTMGAALINTIATSATVSYVAAHGTSPEALTAGAIHGYTTAFTFSAIVLAVAAAAALGFGLSFPWASVASTVMRQTPAGERGSALGVLTAFYDLFVGISSFAAGAVATRFGYPAVFLTAAGALGAAAIAGRFVFAAGPNDPTTLLFENDFKTKSMTAD